VKDFSEVGKHFYMPVRTYSSGMKTRLTFGTSMGIKFDTYLVDETTAVGDARFRRKSHAVFRDRMINSSAIMVSHNMNELRSFCDAGLVLNDGHLTYFDDLEDAIKTHEKLME
jgi:capsular polysaccharide transport system ATP-binding protein